MQLFAVSRTEAGIRHRQAILRGQEDARLQKAHDAKAEEIKCQIAELQKQLQRHEPLLIKSEYRRVEERACRVFQVTPLALKSKRRHRRLAIARQFIMYWAMRRTLLSSSQIGRLLGGRDHTTALHGRHKYRELRASMGRTLREAR